MGLGAVFRVKFDRAKTSVFDHIPRARQARIPSMRTTSFQSAAISSPELFRRSPRRRISLGTMNESPSATDDRAGFVLEEVGGRILD